MVKTLLEHGADIRARRVYRIEVETRNFNYNDWIGETALYIILYYGNIEVVRFLLDHGADIQSIGVNIANF
jgi:ankyrin repeat protein